jgi:hypothetical protein
LAVALAAGVRDAPQASLNPHIAGGTDPGAGVHIAEQ